MRSIRFVSLTFSGLAFSSIAILSGCGDDTAQTPASQCALGDASEETPAAPPIHTPRWAFEPWISKDISDGPDTYAFVQGFIDRDIPVGAVVLDSPWETSYNTLVPNPNRYPDFGKMVSDMHDKGVRVVLWTTAFVNAASFDLEPGGDSYSGAAPAHDDAVACGFFVEGGFDYSWWKGNGASIDFFNPHALAWWHRQQDPLFDMGVDGFKLDFGDSYVTDDPIDTAAGPKPHQAYSEAYYHDFYAYGRARGGDDFVTMVRAYDTSYGFAPRFYARKEDAPVTWMGDNRRDYVGLADALDAMFRSSLAGYPVVGSDIGGYLDRDDLSLGNTIPFDEFVFARWTALGALSPFMQLHGRANLTPWTAEQNGDEITDAYRYWATLHHELVPFFYSLTESAYAGGAMPMVPVGDEASWPGDYRFVLGNALLVAPPMDAKLTRDIVLPPGTYYDFFDPSADAIPGGTTLTAYDTSDLARIPLFFRAGAIVPMAVSGSLTGFGDESSAGDATFVVFPDTTPSSFDVHDEDGATTTVNAQKNGPGFTVSTSRALTTTLFRIRADVAPSTLSIDGASVAAAATREAFDASSSGWFIDAATRSVLVKVSASTSTHTVAAP